MSTARQKANTRKTIALIFFGFAALLVVLRLTGVIVPDMSRAPSLEAAWGMEVGYFLAPVIPFIIGYIFWGSSKQKLLEAEYEEKAAAERQQNAADQNSV